MTRKLSITRHSRKYSTGLRSKCEARLERKYHSAGWPNFRGKIVATPRFSGKPAMPRTALCACYTQTRFPRICIPNCGSSSRSPALDIIRPILNLRLIRFLTTLEIHKGGRNHAPSSCIRPTPSVTRSD